MKKYFRIMLAGALALVMILSLVSCGSSLEMSDVEDALEEYAEDNEDKYEFENVSKEERKAIEVGFEEICKMKGGVEALFTLSEIDDMSAWCHVVEFEESADAKNVEKEIEDALEDFYYAIMMEMAKGELNRDDYDDETWDMMMDMIKEQLEESIEELIPSKIAVERKGNIVFFGAKSVVEDALEAIEDAK